MQIDWTILALIAHVLLILGLVLLLAQIITVCEAGTSNEIPDLDGYYLSDPLWDDLDCPTGNTCCDNPNLPWFYRELNMTTVDDVEVRICTDESFDNEGVLVDQLELYIQ